MKKMYVLFRSLSRHRTHRRFTVALAVLSMSIASLLVLPVLSASASTQNSVFFDNQSGQLA
jgi:hypothetical protein